MNRSVWLKLTLTNKSGRWRNKYWRFGICINGLICYHIGYNVSVTSATHTLMTTYPPPTIIHTLGVHCTEDRFRFHIDLRTSVYPGVRNPAFGDGIGWRWDGCGEILLRFFLGSRLKSYNRYYIGEQVRDCYNSGKIIYDPGKEFKEEWDKFKSYKSKRNMMLSC